MSVSPNPAAPGQQIVATHAFADPKGKDGFMALLPGSVTSIFNVEIGGTNEPWKAYLNAQGMLASFDFATATNISATFTAPQTPGSYQVMTVVPKDGGTDGSEPFTVSASAAPATGGGGDGTKPNPAGSGSGAPNWLTQSHLIPGIPDVAVVGIPVLFLLMRR